MFRFRAICQQLLFIFSVSTASAQVTMEFDRWTTNQGLSQVSVFFIMQDRDGYMWFATENGLNQFDGYEFTHFTHSLYDTNSLSDQLVYAMLEDSEGIMWIACFGGGLNRFDRRTGAFKHYRHDPKNASSISSDFVTTICASPHHPGVLWLGTDGGGLNRFDIRQETFTSFRYNPNDTNSLGGNRIYALNSDDMGNLWIGTRDGLTRFDPDRNRFTRYVSSSSGLSHNEIWHIYKDRDGLLWMSTANGLTRCNPGLSSGLFTSYLHDEKNPASLPHSRIWATVDDDSLRPDFLWVGTHQGLAHLNKKTGLCDKVMRHDPNDAHSLGHNQVWALYKDRFDDIWLGSFGGGVNRINRSKERFNHFRIDPSDVNSIRDNEIWSLYEIRDGRLWVGHRKGVDILAPDGRRIQSIDNSNVKGAAFRLEGTRVQAILEDSDGHIWLGTDGAGIYRYDPAKKSFRRYVHVSNDTSSLSNDFVSFIFETAKDPDRSLWIGTNAGLNRYDRKTGVFERFKQDSANGASISHNRVRCMMEDRNGGLWVGTYGGLDAFDRKTRTFVHHASDPDMPGSLSENRVWVIVEAHDGAIWVGTHIGLNRYDPTTNTFKAFTVREGLPSNEIYGIIEDEQDRLWIATSRGLSRFDPRLEVFTNYYEEDGIQNNEFNGAVFARGKDGRMYFGGINGFTAFYPDRIRPRSVPPPVVITEFRKFDRTFLKDREIVSIPLIVLEYTDDFFGFEFAALSYQNSGKNTYKYKLEGFDRNWISSGKRRYATYTDLDAGEYVFRVIASNSDGVWNTIGASMVVVIHPPWWHTWWFRGLMALCVIGLLWTIYHIRVTRLLEIEKMRVRIASDLHDDIGSTLTRITINSEVIQSSEDIGRIRETAHKIGQLSRDVVRTFSDVIWSIDARNDKFGDLAARIQDMAYQILSPMEIAFTLETKGIDNEWPIPVDVRQNLYLICKEALHNAAKYAHTTSVHITIDNSGEALVMGICDNGQGLPSDRSSRGNGLRNMTMRAERIGGRVAYVNENGLTVRFIGRKLK